MRSLKELRQAVDAVDREIVAALLRRFEITDEIGRVKRATGVAAVRNEAREREVLERVGPDCAEVYRAIMAEAVRREERYFEAGDSQ